MAQTPKPPNTIQCPKCDSPKVDGQSYCREHMREAGRASYTRHRDKNIARTQNWKRANPERANEHVRISKARNPEHYAELARVRCSRRRARMREAFVEDVQPLELYDGVCGICGQDVDPFDYEVDHIVPLAKGGEHSYANSQPAHPLCNRLKRDQVV